MNSKIIYLCIPYSWNPEESFRIANIVSAQLMLKGNIVFSPISHSHPISLEMDPNLQLDHDFWMKQDIALLNKCNEICVVLINENGMNLVTKSRGCNVEIEFCKKNNIPINYLKYYE